jgi:hypothetical protein
LANQRCESTVFVQNATNVHPAAIDPRTLFGPDADADADADDMASQLTDLAALLNTTERHTHQSYCQKGGKKQKRSHGTAGDDANHHADHDHVHVPPAEPGQKENEKCRFAYPKEICNVGHVAVNRC